MSITTEATATKARLNPGRQWVRINHVEFPVEVQPRAGIDMEWVRQLSEFRKEGSEFPPIKVFQTPDGRLIGAEGHHRSLAMFKADEESILCDVVDGTLEDAIVFAAGSNRSNGVKPMGPKDITKAVEMLLMVEGWWERPDTQIGAHVGCSGSKVGTVRARVAIATGRTIPVTLVHANGRKVTRPDKRLAGRMPTITVCDRSKEGRTTRYAAHYRGKMYTHADRSELVELLRRSMDRDAAKLKTQTMWVRLRRLGFDGVLNANAPGLRRAMCRPGFLCVPTRFEDVRDLPAAIGQLIAAHEYKGDPTARMIVLCYPDEGPAKLIELYKRRGFEFMTPEELEEALKPSDP